MPQWCGVQVQSLIRELSAAVPSAEYSNLLVAWDARKLPSSTIIANDEPGTLNRTPAGRRVHLLGDTGSGAVQVRGRLKKSHWQPGIPRHRTA